MHRVTSIYRWKGRVEEDEEYALNIKTTTALVKKATEKILELHSYETPCIVSYKIDYGSKAYLDWIAEETI
jgi:periplasmic divalent cation tolerance protein